MCWEVSIRSESESASFEQVFWRAEKKTGVIQDHKPPKLPVSKKTAQNVTAEKKHCEFRFKTTLFWRGKEKLCDLRAARSRSTTMAATSQEELPTSRSSTTVILKREFSPPPVANSISFLAASSRESPPLRHRAQNALPL